MILRSPKLYLGQFDLSGYANQGTPTVDVEKKNPMTFADNGMKRAEAGLETVAFKGKCFWTQDPARYITHAILGAYYKVQNIPVSWSPQGGAAGNMVQFFKALEATYTSAGQIGDYMMADFEAVATGDSPNVYGTVLDVGAKVAGATGAAVALGAVGATQRLYALLHIMACTGTLTMKVQSDDAAGFASPTDRVTFAPATTEGWQWLELAGPVTDTYWRSSFTLPSGTATFSLHVGIL